MFIRENWYNLYMPYQILGHTADVRLRVEAETLEELFRDALLGMMAIVRPDYKKGKQHTTRIIALDAPDLTALLVDFLNEVLFQSHVNKEIYTDVTFAKFDEKSLEAKLEGIPVDEFDEDIKAVTYHEADVKKNKEGQWEITLIFDI